MHECPGREEGRHRLQEVEGSGDLYRCVFCDYERELDGRWSGHGEHGQRPADADPDTTLEPNAQPATPGPGIEDGDSTV